MSEEIPRPTVFAFIVDGEVAWLHGYDYRAEQAIAALRSNPIVVEVPNIDVDRMVTPENGPNYIGWTYLDGVYSPPA
jgi:hypothetical protein